MAVRAHDIALGDLGQDASVPCPTDQRRNTGKLRLSIAVIEVHRARLKSAAAVEARDVSQTIEHRSLSAPRRPLLLKAFRGPRVTGCDSCSVLLPGTQAMAVRTDDVALGNLGKDLRRRRQRRPAGHHIERLGRGIPMIEVHLVWLEAFSTVGARDSTEVAEQLDHAGLADANPLQLGLPVSAVILDVVGSLARASCHSRI
jgi:hypothetical protein